MLRRMGRASFVLALTATALAPTLAQAPLLAASDTNREVSARVVANMPSPPPAGYRAASMDWATPQRAWVLGTAACAKKSCSYVLETVDGAKTWKTLAVVRPPIASIGDSSKPGVSEIRFNTKRVGWMFAPWLYRTADGGRSWSRQTIPGHGKQVLALAAAQAATYVVVSPCAWMTGYCNSKPLSLWRSSTKTPRRWVEVPVALPMSVSADVSVFATTVYVVDTQFGQPDKFHASLDGVHFSPRSVPCDKSSDVQLSQAVATSRRGVDLLCDGNPGFSKAEKFVFRSSNAGKTYSYAGTMGPYGIEAQLAVSPSGNLLVASWSDGSFMYVNTGGKKWQITVGVSDGGAGWNDVQYVTKNKAWVVYSPASLFNGVGKILVTTDAGRHWHLKTF